MTPLIYCTTKACLNSGNLCPAGACRSCCITQHSHWKYHTPPAITVKESEDEWGMSKLPAVYTYGSAKQTYAPIETEQPPVLGAVEEQEREEVMPSDATSRTTTYFGGGGYL